MENQEILNDFYSPDSSVILIKEFANPSQFNLGLEKYGMAKWEGSDTVLDIPKVNGRYNFSNIPPDELKAFQEFFGVDFESKEGKEFLDDYQIRISSGITALDMKNVEHRFQRYVLESMQTLVAPSLEAALSPMARFKYYIADEVAETESRISKKEMLYEAATKLFTLKQDSPKYMVALAKYLLPANAGIGDSAVLAFDKLDKFINNELEINAIKFSNARTFLATLKLDKEFIYVTVDVKMGILKNILRRDSDGWYFNTASGTKYGKNVSEIVDFLTNPKNIEELGTGTGSDAPYALRMLLRNS